MSPGGRGGEGASDPIQSGPGSPSRPPTPSLLLYDGTCGFCAASVQWVLRRDRRGTLLFAPLQGETARPILAGHPELAKVDSVVWVEEGGEVLVRSAAALRVARYLGGAWSVAARLGALVPRPLRDWVYDQIAKHRHTIIPGDPSCMLPSPEERARFLP